MTNYNADDTDTNANAEPDVGCHSLKIYGIKSIKSWLSI